MSMNSLDHFPVSTFLAVQDDELQLGVLSGALEVVVCELLSDVVRERMEKIVEKLNSLGHNLEPYVVKRDEFAYRDACPSANPRERLRLAADLIISSGYADFEHDYDE